ncbi:MAG TPA: hypothetical protein VGI30_12895 [Caulobacteraceae bacterium]|jgi:hypothetical protein
MMRWFLAAAAMSLACSASAGVTGKTLVIRQTVTDYAKWRPIYDAHRAVRASSGLSNCRVQSSDGDVNDVVVICDMADVAKGKAFASSKSLAEAMARAGVVGKPSFYFLTGH